jgi:hypothetical protein
MEGMKEEYYFISLNEIISHFTILPVKLSLN